MTDAPERIWAGSLAFRRTWKKEPMNQQEMDHLTPYISEARHQAELAAVLEEAAARADQKAAWFRKLHGGHKLETVFDREFRHDNFCKAKGAESAAEAIRALRPDARAALDKLIAEAVRAEREACAALVEEWQAYTLYGRERISGEMAAEIRNRGGGDE